MRNRRVFSVLASCGAIVGSGLSRTAQAGDLPAVEVRAVNLFAPCSDAGGTAIADSDGDFASRSFVGPNGLLERIGGFGGDRNTLIGNSGGGPVPARNSDCNDTGSDDGAPGAKAGLAGNPVVVSTGSKVETALDFESTGEMALLLSRTCNSAGHGVGLFGKHRKSNFGYKSTFGTNAVDAFYHATRVQMVVERFAPDGRCPGRSITEDSRTGG